ncbi:hypothetical protein BC834DRAFT_212057 [Gloeopeniophorella convolvens]|nr:hypothetical protein BC834DRAFT_212057 [Gloeopeniophorella convolvens]
MYITSSGAGRTLAASADGVCAVLGLERIVRTLIYTIQVIYDVGCTARRQRMSSFVLSPTSFRKGAPPRGCGSREAAVCRVRSASAAVPGFDVPGGRASLHGLGLFNRPVLDRSTVSAFLLSLLSSLSFSFLLLTLPFFFLPTFKDTSHHLFFCSSGYVPL